MSEAALAPAPVCTRCALHAESVFRVDGLCCGEEAAILQRRLRPLSGMEDVSADVVGQKLHVKYDAAILSTNAIVDAVAETGCVPLDLAFDPIEQVDGRCVRHMAIAPRDVATGRRA